MNTTLIAMLTALGALIASVVTAIASFRVNRATSVKLIAEAQDVSHKTALAEAEASLAFADRRFTALEKDYSRCCGRLESQHRSLDAVIEAIDAIMSRVQPTNGHEVTVTVTGAEVAAVRGAVREARRHLN